MKNKANLLLIILLLGGFILGCSRSSKPETAEAKITPAPVATNQSEKPAIEVTKIIGASPDSVKKILGEPGSSDKLIPKPDFNYDLSYDYSWGFINFRNNKASYIHYETEKGFDTTFALGKSVGVELFNVIPATVKEYVVIYKNTEINGMKFAEVRILLNEKKKHYLITFQV